MRTGSNFLEANLNALDGVATQEGNVLFMTTNHAERLDEALIRAGRIDERVELGSCDEDQLRRLYLKFQPDDAAALAYAAENAGQALSPAPYIDALRSATVVPGAAP